jgi:hypothetical protein
VASFLYYNGRQIFKSPSRISKPNEIPIGLGPERKSRSSLIAFSGNTKVVAAEVPEVGHESKSRSRLRPIRVRSQRRF